MFLHSVKIEHINNVEAERSLSSTREYLRNDKSHCGNEEAYYCMTAANLDFVEL